MPSNNSNIQILRKDESKTLSDGDKFAFLTDTWYLVKLEYKEETPKAISGDVSTVLISNPSSKNTIAPSTSNTMVSQSTSIKRSAEDPYSRERKKLKLVSDSLDKLIDNIDQIVAQDAQVDDNNKTEQSNTTQVFKRETISDSDDEDSDELLPEVTRDTEIIEGIEKWVLIVYYYVKNIKWWQAKDKCCNSNLFSELSQFLLRSLLGLLQNISVCICCSATKFCTKWSCINNSKNINQKLILFVLTWKWFMFDD